MAPKVAKILASQPAAEEPAAKKAKVDEPKAEEPKVEVEKYQEPDAPKDNRPPLKEKISFDTAETTLNVVPALGGKLLNCLSEGGMSFLLAGARANVAQKAGRYMFEAKVVQSMSGGGKNTLRIGFSTSSSGLIVGEDASSVYFDSEGSFVAAKKKQQIKNGRFGNNVIAVVLNLDPKSPNANTVALYRDGIAVGDAMPLPEDLKGQALFPHIAFRSASVQVNFGQDAMKQLPFKCTMLQSAAASDVRVAPSKQPKDGKYEVVMPVGFPDEGTFDWLDGFMQKNPQYVELSDRKILQWAQASGHHSKGGKASNDKPQFQFGIRELDDMSVRKVINAVAPVIPRNYLIMEVKSNLVAAERQELLKKFNYPCYKKTARVVMGVPGKEFQSVVQTKLLKEKQTKSDNAWKAKKADAERKKLVAQRQKDAEKRRKEADKKRAEDKKKKEDDEKEAKGEKVEEKEEPKEEEKAEPEADKEVEEEETEAPVVELTAEEKKSYFLPKSVPDLSEQVMSANYAKFSTPDDAEGFDDIVYEWDKADKSAAYLKTWVLNKKLTTRIDGLKPGQEFKENKEAFAKLCKEWKDKLTAFKAGPKKKVEEGADDIDIFSVENVCDMGKGVPLFHKFGFEDWELLNLRFQFCWLILSFKVDAKDSDRAGIPMDHLNFYFGKYYGGQINHKKYGVTNTEELLALIKDAVTTKDGLVVSQLSDDLENLDIFLKLTEEHRRERQRRLDAGDETARLKITPPAEPKPAAKPAPKPEVKPAAKPEAKAAPKAATTTVGTPAPKAAVQKPVVSQKGSGKKGKW